MSYGARQYGSHARVLVAADIPGGGAAYNVSGTSTRTRTGSLALTTRQNIGGTGTRARTGSLSVAQTAYTQTWNLELSQSGYRERDASLTLTVDVAAVAPPASAHAVYIKKVTVVYPAPTLDQYGRPT